MSGRGSGVARSTGSSCRVVVLGHYIRVDPETHRLIKQVKQLYRLRNEEEAVLRLVEVAVSLLRKDAVRELLQARAQHLLRELERVVAKCLGTAQSNTRGSN